MISAGRWDRQNAGPAPFLVVRATGKISAVSSGRYGVEHAQISALCRLLHHSGTALGDLARTEHAIAGAFADLTRRTGSAAAAERLRLSREVTAAVEIALQRVTDLRRLAEDATAAPPPPR